MSAVIYSFRDSNMAGQAWRWSFGLHRSSEGTFTLMAVQEFDDPEDIDDDMSVSPAPDLVNGTEIYECFVGQLEDAGGDIASADWRAIAACIIPIDPLAARQFAEAAMADAEDDEVEVFPGGFVVRSGRMPKAEELALYRAMDAPKVVAVTRGERTDYMRQYIEGVKRHDAERRKQAEEEPEG